jgi:hypothetical protein
VKVPDGGEQAAWEQVRGHSEGRLTDWGIKILGSGLKGYVKSILIEPRYVCRDYRDLFSSFYSRKFLPRSSFCSRLHFFCRARPDGRWRRLRAGPAREVLYRLQRDPTGSRSLHRPNDD